MKCGQVREKVEAAGKWGGIGPFWKIRKGFLEEEVFKSSYWESIIDSLLKMNPSYVTFSVLRETLRQYFSEARDPIQNCGTHGLR